MKDIEYHLTRTGILDCQVCVPEEATDAEIIGFAERVLPSGTISGWKVRREGDPLLNDDPERTPCGSRPGCVHVVLDA